MHALEDLTTQAAETTDTARPYSTRAWGEIARMHLPAPVWFFGQCFALGFGRVRLHAVFGQGGLGKSRIGLNVARNQVLGLPFGDISTGGEPLTHLFMGTENGLHRLQHDITRMSASLSPEQLHRLDRHIFLASLEAQDDPYVTLSDPGNVARWRVTIEQRRPDVLWIDPWGDVQAGDANADQDARWTITELTKVLGSVNQNSALVVLAHSRTGTKNIAEAIGYDGANFGKGSKALYSCARCVLNLAPGNSEDNPPVLVACPKNNDGTTPPPFALLLDANTMTYERDPDFNVEAWIADVRSKGSGRRKAGSRQRLDETRAFAVLNDETNTSAGVRDRLRSEGATRDEADDLVKRLVADGKWEQWRPHGKNQPTYIGTPSAIQERKRQWNKQHEGNAQ